MKIINKSLVIFIALGLLSACASNARMFEIEPAVLIKRVAAVYPEELKSQGIEGTVKVQYTVSASGTVLDAFVMESKPAGVFDEAALAAAREMKYSPRIVDGQPQAIRGVVYRFFFENPK